MSAGKVATETSESEFSSERTSPEAGRARAAPETAHAVATLPVG
jgi:hypothetical protein